MVQKKQNWIWIGLIVLGIYTFSQGKVFTGAMVCTSNEPTDIHNIDGQTSIDIIQAELSEQEKLAIATDCDFIGEGSICSAQIIKNLTNYDTDLCFGDKENGLCYETYILGFYVSNSNITLELPTKEQILQGYAQGNLYLSTYKGVTYYSYTPRFTEFYEFEIDDEVVNSYYIKDEGIIVGSSFNGVNTIEKYIDTYYSCQETNVENGGETSSSSKKWYESPIIWIMIIFAFILFGGRKS